MYAVIYDGNCNLCVTLVKFLEQIADSKGSEGSARFGYVPMQDEVALKRLGVSAEDCEMGMLLIELTAAGEATDRRWQGSDAAEEIGRLLPMGGAFVQAYRSMPGAKAAGDRTYTFVRDNRYQLFGKRDRTYRSQQPIIWPDCDQPQNQCAQP